MPYSLVFNILPLSPISPEYLEGKHLHALFLSVVSSVDPDLGQYFHDSQPNKAFTVSPLQTQITSLSKEGGRDKILQWQHSKSISAGKPCWWRISLLEDSIFGKLTKLWLHLNPEKSWHLGSADLYITSILGTSQTQQPWANACSCEDLLSNASETERLFRFILATPTAFRQRKYDTALPTADAIFNSLLKRWQKYSAAEFSPLPIDSIYPSFFDIRTEIITDKRSKFIGCVGEVHYRLFGDVTPLVVKQLNALADFALYCGIGRKTTMGMGMVRRLNSEN
jgi:CRISPR-associated endoribonuclease Cas6